MDISSAISSLKSSNSSSDSPCRRKRGNGSTGEPTVRVVQLQKELPSKNYKIQTSRTPSWLPEGFSTSYWSLYGDADGKGRACDPFSAMALSDPKLKVNQRGKVWLYSVAINGCLPTPR